MSHLLQVAICSAFAIFECKVCVFLNYIFQYYHCSLNIHSAYGSYKRSYRHFGTFKHNLLCTSVKCANVNLTYNMFVAHIHSHFIFKVCKNFSPFVVQTIEFVRFVCFFVILTIQRELHGIT